MQLVMKRTPAVFFLKYLGYQAFFFLGKHSPLLGALGVSWERALHWHRGLGYVSFLCVCSHFALWLVLIMIIFLFLANIGIEIVRVFGLPQHTTHHTILMFLLSICVPLQTLCSVFFF